MIERLEVFAGPGTVIRYGAVVAWAAPSASPALVSFLAQSARNLATSGRGGREMSDHIATVLHERDPEPHVAFAVVGPDGLGWAALLHGPVQAWDGQRWLAPTPSPGWLHAVITPQPSVMVNVAGSPLPVVSPDSMWDLDGGVVPGAGFVLFPNATRASDPDAARSEVAAVALPPEPHPEPQPDPTVASPPVEDQTLETKGLAEVFQPTQVLEAIPAEEPDPTRPHDAPQAAGPAPEPPPPGPPGSIDLRRPPTIVRRPPLAAGDGPDRTVPGAPVVAGVLCERDHLNRPGMRDCVRCGSPMRADTPGTVSGSRPPLGCLVGDDGAIWRLDAAYLVGSNPATDPTARGGVARPLPLGGEGLSAAHAEVRLADWDVEIVDRSSGAGTFVFEPGADGWVRLRPYEPRTLKPGTHVAFAQRIVTYLTPWIPARPEP